MRIWRIYDHKAPYAMHPEFNPLGGAGGLHSHARWHERGQPVTYSAASPSLALLEILVHQDPERFKEQTLLQIEINQPDGSLEYVSASELVQLLRDASNHDRESATRAYGTRWLKEQRSLALVVPSFVMPFENNIIINPLHAEFHRVRVTSTAIVTLDRRLLRRFGIHQDDLT